MRSTSARAANRVLVIGAGIGGLVAALELAAQGVQVLVLDRAPGPGGKMREVAIGDQRLDAGPTVLTMPWILDEIFAAAGTSLSAEVALRPAGIIARHAWSAAERLDLYADLGAAEEAIARFSGPAEGRRYRRFCREAARAYRTLEHSYIRAAKPTPFALVRHAGLKGIGSLWRVRPFSSLSAALARIFHDPRLRQLFGRYATYCGSSPFQAPATLMLIAHVEQCGVWLVEGGMHRIALALQSRATALGASFRYETQVEEILLESGSVAAVRLCGGERLAAASVIVNADAAAVACGLLGRAVANAARGADTAPRSLSALTWALCARTRGFPLLRHNVFFSRDYAAEFDDVFRRDRLPLAPSVYVCAQDRAGEDDAIERPRDRLLCLVNAPASGDRRAFGRDELEACARSAFGLLERCGLEVARCDETTVLTTPADFARLYPGTGGALYGRASHGWRASFRRLGARTAIPGLYLAGGSVHPGPGVPMAALSGRQAAYSVRADLAPPSRRSRSR